MSSIKTPKANLSDDQRILACDEALEGDFKVTIDMLVMRAVEAGWTEEEAEEASCTYLKGDVQPHSKMRPPTPRLMRRGRA